MLESSDRYPTIVAILPRTAVEDMVVAGEYVTKGARTL